MRETPMNKDERLRQIAALAHELRQPLNLISLSCGNVQKYTELNKTEISNEYIKNKCLKIFSKIDEASRISEKIMEIAKENNK